MRPQGAFVVHGARSGALPLVLDSPHSGSQCPADPSSVRSAHELRDAEDACDCALSAGAAEPAA